MLRARLNVSAANAKVFAPLLGLPDNAAELGPNSAEVALRRSFYDTALIAESPSLAAVASMSGVAQMLFGSDWPFAGLMYPPVGDPQPAIGEGSLLRHGACRDRAWQRSALAGRIRQHSQLVTA